MIKLIELFPQYMKAKIGKLIATYK